MGGGGWGLVGGGGARVSDFFHKESKSICLGGMEGRCGLEGGG